MELFGEILTADCADETDENLTPPKKSKLLLWISHVTMAVSLFMLLLLGPLCYCPRYYLSLSVAGIIPLLYGPRLYRCFGAAYILTTLLIAVGEHRSALIEVEQIEHVRSQAGTPNP